MDRTRFLAQFLMGLTLWSGCATPGDPDASISHPAGPAAATPPPCRLLRETRVLGPDGTPDGSTTYTYDAAGHRLTEERDGGPYNGVADGAVDNVTTYTNDARGNKLTAASDGDAGRSPPDGAMDNVTTYTYDAAGHELTLTNTGADGEVHYRFTRTYDGAGKLLKLVTDGGEEDGPDGTANDVTSYTYDAAGNRLTEENDGGRIFGRGVDGIVDERTVYTYDGSGNRLTEERDGDSTTAGDTPDGTVDQRTTYTYDAAGNRLTQERDGEFFAVRPGPDGIVDARSVYTYDARGSRLTEESDGDAGPADGTVDQRTTYTYDCMAVFLFPPASSVANATPFVFNGITVGAAVPADVAKWEQHPVGYYMAPVTWAGVPMNEKVEACHGVVNSIRLFSYTLSSSVKYRGQDDYSYTVYSAAPVAQLARWAAALDVVINGDGWHQVKQSADATTGARIVAYQKGEHFLGTTAICEEAKTNECKITVIIGIENGNCK